jgi:hypothetical protein
MDCTFTSGAIVWKVAVMAERVAGVTVAASAACTLVALGAGVAAAVAGALRDEQALVANNESTSAQQSFSMVGFWARRGAQAAMWAMMLV